LAEDEHPGRRVRVIVSHDGILRLEVLNMDDELIFRVDIGQDEAPQRVLEMEADRRLIAGQPERRRIVEQEARTETRQPVSSGEAALIVRSFLPRT
jgi:hypothetical protein